MGDGRDRRSADRDPRPADREGPADGADLPAGARPSRGVRRRRCGRRARRDPAGHDHPPTAQHAMRQGKVWAHNVAASLGFGKAKNYSTATWACGPPRPPLAVANPMNIPLSDFPPRPSPAPITCMRFRGSSTAGRSALAYLTDVFFERTVVSIGLATQEDARFSASEGIPMPATRLVVAQAGATAGSTAPTNVRQRAAGRCAPRERRTDSVRRWA